MGFHSFVYGQSENFPSKDTIDFSKYKLEDATGKIVRISDFKGKVVFLDFWFTGCAGCSMFYEQTFRRLKMKYNNQVVFVSISIDKDREKWHRSVASGIYTDSLAVNLYTRGEEEEHKLIQDLGIRYYPALFILDENQVFVSKDENNELRKLEGNKAEQRLLEALLPSEERD